MVAVVGGALGVDAHEEIGAGLVGLGRALLRARRAVVRGREQRKTAQDRHTYHELTSPVVVYEDLAA